MSLLDIAKANGVEKAINEAERVCPEIELIASFPMAGLQVRSIVYTGQSNSAGSFRKVNAGTSAITETSEPRMFQCYTAEPRIEVDRAEADRYEGGAKSYIGGKGIRALKQEFLAWCKIMYYGTTINADGFPGLLSTYDSANMTIDATGTTANTGSSVWLLRVAQQGNFEDDGVRWRMGQDGKMQFDPVQQTLLTDVNDSTKRFVAYTTQFTAYPGFQIQTLNSVVRIKNLTAETNKGLTDALINRALALFPAGKGPNLALGTLRSAQQWQSSRTATSPTGAPAPWPTSIVGVDGQTIPFRVTEAISNTEAIA